MKFYEVELLVFLFWLKTVFLTLKNGLDEIFNFIVKKFKKIWWFSLIIRVGGTNQKWAIDTPNIS